MFPEMEMTTNTTTVTTSSVKTPEAENETPTRIQTAKISGFSNGVLKRHLPLHLHGGYHNHGGSFNSNLHPPPAVVTYKECLKNHAASLGGHAVDGCGEFMPSPTSTPSDPTSLKCAACGCHRNFHRREPEELLPPPSVTPALEYQPHHRHHPPPPSAAEPGNRSSGGHSSPSSPSPPPISSSYYPSAPHMLLALSAGLTAPPADNNGIPITPTAANPAGLPGSNSNGRKRFRTKFTQEQKEKMHEFAERIGWRIQKRDEDLIENFCNSIGVDKSVLKVWMHNNKNNFGNKREPSNSTPGSGAGSIPPPSVTPEHGNGNGNGNGHGIEFSIHYHHDPDDSKNGIHPHELSHHQIHHRDSVVVTNGNGNGNASSCSS